MYGKYTYKNLLCTENKRTFVKNIDHGNNY